MTPVRLEPVALRSRVKHSTTEPLPSHMYVCIYACMSVCLSVCLYVCMYVCLFVFVALRPMSTAMVIAGRSVHLTTLFPGQA